MIAGGHVSGTRVEMEPRFTSLGWVSCVSVGTKWFEKERMWLDVWMQDGDLKEWHALKAEIALEG